ncbi:cytochrome P450 [Corynebacterium halotolerans]|uniref:Cytochrome P450 n=1 Tax=Corynebacterium halotolerans YIM 70093 = DSM 44683 TaxID=1121362 RepID=M1P616_9CORY|nr:cytochrome P450 [Corynebacterium halotolerans]AGF72081.1 cytochrome P450 [Corynebacterium halotolerans YIM 70093 = DSM 44683]
MTSNAPARVRFEQGLNFLRSGYLFASRIRDKAGVAPDSDTPVKLRMLGRPAVLVRGEEGVRLFYDGDRMKRNGAMPIFIRNPLFGPGAVHNLDGKAHETRKTVLVDLAYNDEHVERFKELVAEELETMLGKWATGSGNVFDDTAVAYGRAAFRWAELPLSDREMEAQARRMSRLVDAFGQPSRNAIAWVDRFRLDRWATRLIRDVRSGRTQAPADSVLARMANLHDENGELVDDRTAGVDLQNLTRPTVAVGRFAAFAAAALVEHPEWVERIRAASVAAGGGLIDIPEAVAFAHEVRRTYPFVPMLPALATTDTEIKGCPIKKGQRVLLDILGTNTAPTEWKDAGAFEPERFLGVEDAEEITSFIPQGGGDVLEGHRCPGEKIAMTALSAAVVALCRPQVSISGEIEDVAFPWTKMLTRPSTGVRVNVS